MAMCMVLMDMTTIIEKRDMVKRDRMNRDMEKRDVVKRVW